MTVETVLGSGGFGQVFAARFPSGARVAVKTVLTSLLDDSELAVFLNEIALAVGLNHPNVVRVLHVLGILARNHAQLVAPDDGVFERRTSATAAVAAV